MKRETRKRWERANAHLDAVSEHWDHASRMNMPCVSISSDTGSDATMQVGASLALDGLDVSELP